jgi:hypothetical protein
MTTSVMQITLTNLFYDYGFDDYHREYQNNLMQLQLLFFSLEKRTLDMLKSLEMSTHLGFV